MLTNSTIIKWNNYLRTAKKYTMNKVQLILISLFVTIQLFGQTGTLRGFVYEESSGEPAMFSNVILEGTNIGGVTDANGFYNLSKVPVGTYTITVSYIGYDQQSQRHHSLLQYCYQHVRMLLTNQIKDFSNSS